MILARQKPVNIFKSGKSVRLRYTYVITEIYNIQKPARDSSYQMDCLETGHLSMFSPGQNRDVHVSVFQKSAFHLSNRRIESTSFSMSSRENERQAAFFHISSFQGKRNKDSDLCFLSPIMLNGNNFFDFAYGYILQFQN
jgi:hypothetical protein